MIKVFSEFLNPNDLVVCSFTFEGKTYLANNHGGIIEHIPAARTEAKNYFVVIINGRRVKRDTNYISWMDIVRLSYPEDSYLLNVVKNPIDSYNQFRVSYSFGDTKNIPLYPHDTIYDIDEVEVIINCTTSHPVETCNCQLCNSQ
jgi:hypothetical protein